MSKPKLASTVVRLVRGAHTDDGAHVASQPSSADFPAGLPREVDVVLAVAGLLATAPLLAACAAAVATTPGGVLFRQQRVGQGGRLFWLLKFRTMGPHVGGPQVTASGDTRITRVGRWLRKSKLDELPQLWNVLVGDLALVGPRAEVPRYVNFDDPLWAAVLRAKPGITDPVSIMLRNEEELLAAADGGDPERVYLEVLQRFKLLKYLEYLRTRGWASDLLVLAKTAVAVLHPGVAPPPAWDEIAALAKAAH